MSEITCLYHMSQKCLGCTGSLKEEISFLEKKLKEKEERLYLVTTCLNNVYVHLDSSKNISEAIKIIEEILNKMATWK